MSEFELQMICGIKLLLIAVYAFLYGYGGMKNKLIRRALASFILVAGFMYTCVLQGILNWYFMSWWPLLWMATSLGYGADSMNEKIKKRTIYGLACGFSPVVIAALTQQYTMFAIHIVLCVAFSVLFGARPAEITELQAREEETIIAIPIASLPLFFV